MLIFRTMVQIALVIAVVTMFASGTRADDKTSLANAMQLCKTIGKPCEVMADKAAVIAAPNIPAQDGPRFCYRASGQMRQHGLVFDPGWTLYLRQVGTGYLLAFCAL